MTHQDCDASEKASAREVSARPEAPARDQSHSSQQTFDAMRSASNGDNWSATRPSDPTGALNTDSGSLFKDSAVPGINFTNMFGNIQKQLDGISHQLDGASGFGANLSEKLRTDFEVLGKDFGQLGQILDHYAHGADGTGKDAGNSGSGCQGQHGDAGGGSNGSKDGGDNAPPAANGGGDMTPPSASGGDMTPPAASGGDMTPPAASGGDMTPPSASGGDMTPPAATGGDMTPPAANTGGDMPPVSSDPGGNKLPGDKTSPATGGGVFGPASGNFSTTDGHFIGPDGKQFVAKGINIYDSQMGEADKILAKFPDINTIRLAVGTQDSNSAQNIQPFLDAMSAKHIAVIVEDHHADGNNPNNVLTGGALANETNWYAQIAAANKNNPYVQFGTANEPVGSAQDLANQESAIYDAIRGAGNNNMVFLEANGSGPLSQSPQQQFPDAFRKMHNVAMDVHNYAWVAEQNNTSTDTETNNFIQQAQAVQSADGIMPVFFGEFAPSSSDQTPDAKGQDVLNSTFNAVNSGRAAGYTAWSWQAGPIDSLASNPDFANQVAADMAGVKKPQ